MVAQNVRQAYLSPTAPTISQVQRCYGEQVAISWLCIQLENLNDFSGTKDKMDLPQQISLARLLLVEYYYLKVTEFQLFFHRVKCGYYGHFYGAVDTVFITNALLTFLNGRRVALGEYEAEEQEKLRIARQESARQECVTYQEYLEWKRKKEQKNENV